MGISLHEICHVENGTQKEKVCAELFQPFI